MSSRVHDSIESGNKCMAVIGVWDGKFGPLSNSIRLKTYCFSSVLGTRHMSPEI